MPGVLYTPGTLVIPLVLPISWLSFIHIDVLLHASTQHGLAPACDLATSVAFCEPREAFGRCTIVLSYVMLTCAVSRRTVSFASILASDTNQGTQRLGSRAFDARLYRLGLHRPTEHLLACLALQLLLDLTHSVVSRTSCMYGLQQ